MQLFIFMVCQFSTYLSMDGFFLVVDQVFCHQVLTPIQKLIPSIKMENLHPMVDQIDLECLIILT